MANHLTPEELSDELGMDRDAIIKLCIEEGVPIYHGQDRQASLPGAAPGPRPARRPARLTPPRRRRGVSLVPGGTPARASASLASTSRARAGLRGRDFAAGFFAFAGRCAVPAFAASTLALSASSRSTAGAAGASGSLGGRSSPPCSFASSSARRSRR